MTISSKQRGAWGELADPRTKGDWAKLYIGSALGAARNNPRFEEVRHFSFFIGYARSGHTLVASMLNAHPEVVIANELDAVRFVRHRFLRRQLYWLLLQRDDRFGSTERTWSGYQYEVPGQFQGRVERLRVLGDKRARSSVLQIAKDPSLLDRLRRRVGVPIRVVHVTRNPYDNIATEARRHKMTLGQSTEWYERMCRAVAVVRPLLDGSELVDLRYETFVEHPGPALADLCRFIEVEPADPYLEACAGIVWPSTNRSRDAVEWTDSDRAGVERLIDRYEVLQSYSFDD